MRKELNPNHPVTQEMREQWHKILGVLMWKYGLQEFVMTTDDLERFVADHPEGINLTVRPKGHTLTVRIVGDAEAARLAKQEGGLPI